VGGGGSGWFGGGGRYLRSTMDGSEMVSLVSVASMSSVCEEGGGGGGRRLKIFLLAGARLGAS